MVPRGEPPTLSAAGWRTTAPQGLEDQTSPKCPRSLAARSGRLESAPALPGLDPALGGEQLGGEDRTAGGAAHGVVRQGHEAVVEERGRPEPADGHRHAVASVAVEPGLWPRLVLEVGEEGTWGAGEAEPLGPALEGLPQRQHLLAGGLLLELDEGRRHVAVAGRHPDALGADDRLGGRDDPAVLDGAPDLQGLLLALLLLALDEGDEVVHHLRPGLERLSGAADGLVGADRHPPGPELHEGVEGRDVAQ